MERRTDKNLFTNDTFKQKSSGWQRGQICLQRNFSGPSRVQLLQNREDDRLQGVVCVIRQEEAAPGAAAANHQLSELTVKQQKVQGGNARDR